MIDQTFVKCAILAARRWRCRGNDNSGRTSVNQVRSAATQAYTAEALQEKARRLAPVLRDRAAATGQARRVPDETIKDFWDAGLWYLMKPKKFGGPEVRPDIALSVAYELARGDGSAAWVWAVMSIHDFLVALWPEEFQREYWAKDTLSASSFAPTGAAKPADGGYRVSGKWNFCSGIDNADWLLLGVFFGPPAGGSPMPDIRYVMVPKGDYKIIDDWHVFGLRGTGSKAVAVEDIFVPNHRICGLGEMVQGVAPGSKVHDSPLYKTSFFTIIPFTISSPANGIARGAFEAFIEEMKVREGSFDHSPLSKKPGMQLAVAEAGAMIDAANLLYRHAFRRTMDKIFAGEPISLEDRARNRRDQGYAVMQARLAAEKLFTAQAGRGIYEGNRVQRAYADLQALQGHIVAGWEMPAYSYGQIVLGGAPSDPFT
jgi:alkylation response protein AidB-like acyl-CoA dehydrogenase